MSGPEPGKARRPVREPQPARLVALAGAAVVALNYPLLVIWDQDATVLGLPVLGVALFSLWAVLIAALAWVSERGPARPMTGPPGPTSAAPPSVADWRDTGPQGDDASPTGRQRPGPMDAEPPPAAQPGPMSAAPAAARRV